MDTLDWNTMQWDEYSTNYDSNKSITGRSIILEQNHNKLGGEYFFNIRFSGLLRSRSVN